MAGLEGNKAFAAILVAGMAFMVAGFIADLVVHPEELEKTAITIQGAAESMGGPARVIIPTILPLMAKADVSAGASTAATACGACHSFTQGGAVMVGPNLYNVVGAKIASAAGYSFSASLAKVGGTWSYEQLNKWLFDPQSFAPGTHMTYPGMRSIQSRANIIGYLRSLSTTPVALPTATEIAAAQAEQKKEASASAVPAGGGAPAAPAGPSLNQLLASADPGKGGDFAAQACGSCHSFTKGGAAMVGPNLYDVVGAPVAGTPGYSFSPALKKVGGNWDFAKLDDWLTNPQHLAPGTTMSYAGIAQPKMRANVVDYLRTLSDKPVPLPAAAAAPGKMPAPAAKSNAPVSKSPDTTTPGAKTGAQTPSP